MKRLILILVVLFAVQMFSGIAAAQRYPMLDDVADKVVQKYQSATCEQLWEKKYHQQPKSDMELRIIQLLREDAGMRDEFFRRVSIPITLKLFQCGIIP